MRSRWLPGASSAVVLPVTDPMRYRGPLAAGSEAPSRASRSRAIGGGGKKDHPRGCLHEGRKLTASGEYRAAVAALEKVGASLVLAPLPLSRPYRPEKSLC